MAPLICDTKDFQGQFAIEILIASVLQNHTSFQEQNNSWVNHCLLFYGVLVLFQGLLIIQLEGPYLVSNHLSHLYHWYLCLFFPLSIELQNLQLVCTVHICQAILSKTIFLEFLYPGSCWIRLVRLFTHRLLLCHCQLHCSAVFPRSFAEFQMTVGAMIQLFNMHWHPSNSSGLNS